MSVVSPVSLAPGTAHGLLNTPGSQERLPAFSPQSHKDTLLCHPRGFWEQFPIHALIQHKAVSIFRVVFC